MTTLADNMLATADLLASVDFPRAGANLRRSVSTSYYALFARLAALCAERIARSKPASDSFRSVYRAIDHGHARNALLGHVEFGSPLGDNFKRLQEARHWADYSIDPHPEFDRGAAGRFTRAEAQQFVTLARETIGFVDALAPDAKQRLAVLLVARSRR
ncbi:hypothetical protein DFR50_10698 [Roseiarcus fermentans]|uniref:HEPN domain-containing protein n=2 Tax=Roseiarcus fermentans TaxID=1473586 RepID=A0A366FPS3_9HYPH|nr:hypothetical protein DFR50_10698 [Roseiarcus fermentans]